MGTKQVRMEFQVAANDGELAQVTITAGGTQVFSGSLAQTVNPLPDIVLNNETPFSLVQFELAVDNMPLPPGASNDHGQWVTPVDVTIAVTGGNITLQETLANYSAAAVEITPATTPPTYQIVFGNATDFKSLWFNNQPVWTPPAEDRLNYLDNIDTGPGSLLLLDGESVAYQVEMTLYSAS
jgi:hypothetical protein